MSIFEVFTWLLLNTIMDIMLWDFLILYQISYSPQAKRGVIISNKHGTCELPTYPAHDHRPRIPTQPRSAWEWLHAAQLFLLKSKFLFKIPLRCLSRKLWTSLLLSLLSFYINLLLQKQTLHNLEKRVHLSQPKKY